MLEKITEIICEYVEIEPEKIIQELGTDGTEKNTEQKPGEGESGFPGNAFRK